jgi:hypothetical protein
LAFDLGLQTISSIDIRRIANAGFDNSFRDHFQRSIVRLLDSLKSWKGNSTSAVEMEEIVEEELVYAENIRSSRSNPHVKYKLNNFLENSLCFVCPQMKFDFKLSYELKQEGL